MMADPIEILLPEIRSLREATEKGFQDTNQRRKEIIDDLKLDLAGRRKSYESLVESRFTKIDLALGHIDTCIESLKSWRSRIGGAWLLILIGINALVAIGVGLVIAQVVH